MNFISKLPDVGTTIFTIMSQMAEDYKAINLSQGYPDYDPPLALKERLNWHVNNGHNQYAPLAGIAALRQQCAFKIKEYYDRDVNWDTEVTITPGATEAIYCAITAIVQPGDEVIMFDPVYDCYDPAVRLSGGVPIHLKLCSPEYSIDWRQVESAISSKSKVIIVNFPHNPTGSIMSDDDMMQLEEIAVKYDLVVISDEVYEHFVFDGKKHKSVLSSPKLAARSFAVFSFGKSFHATGWKTGYVVASALLTKELRAVHQFVTFVAFTPVQFALADYMASNPEHLQSLPSFYEKKRDIFCSALKESRFIIKPSKGTFFQLADYSRIADVPDKVYAEYLTQEVGVAAIPISVFFDDPDSESSRVVRFCFCKEDDTLASAAKLLCAL
jgi:methionine aminotransferase